MCIKLEKYKKKGFLYILMDFILFLVGIGIHEKYFTTVFCTI